MPETESKAPDPFELMMAAAEPAMQAQSGYSQDSTDPFERMMANASAPNPAIEENDSWFNRYINPLQEGDWLRETLEGAASGVIGVGQGVGELGAAASDYFFGTDYEDSVTRAAERLRDAYGIDPEGFFGKGAELVTQFVIPGIGAMGAASKLALAGRTLAQASKARRFGAAAAALAAGGVTDAAVMNDGMTTIGDWIEMGPTQTEDLIGLEGRERALAALRNRLKFATEGGALGAAVAGVVAPSVARGTAGLMNTTAMRRVAQAVSTKVDDVGRSIDDLLVRRALEKSGSPYAPTADLSWLEKGAASTIAAFRPRSYLPRSVSEARFALTSVEETALKQGATVARSMQKAMDNAMKRLPKGSNIDRASVLDTITSILQAKDAKQKAALMRQLPSDELRSSARAMRNILDRWSGEVLGSDFLARNNITLPSGKTLKDVIVDNMGSYTRRRYRAYIEKNYTPTEASVKDAMDFYRSNVSAVEFQLSSLAKRDAFGTQLTPDFLQKNGLGLSGTLGDPNAKIIVKGKVTEPVASLAVTDRLAQAKTRSSAKFIGGKVARNRLETDMFIERQSVPKPIRELLGEVSDVEDVFLGTISDLSRFVATDRFYASIRDSLDLFPSMRKMFIDPATITAQQKRSLLQSGQFVELGSDRARSAAQMTTDTIAENIDTLDAINKSGWGALNGFLVPNKIYNDLSMRIMADDSIGGRLLNATFGTFLKAKAASQYSKTVLSPITQVRNFITGASFTTANGNVPVVGRDGSMKDAMKIVFANLRNQGDDAIVDALLDAQSRGLMGTGAHVREIQDALTKGLGLNARSQERLGRNLGEMFPGTAVGSSLGATGRAVGKGLTFAENMYLAGDDTWKFFSYTAEQAKLRRALEGATTSEKIRYLVKDGSDIAADKLERIRAGNLSPDDLASEVDDLIKDRAAQIVRDTLPNYDKAGSDIVKLARKLPIGNFISFPAEIMRTGMNIVKQSLDDMASEIPGVRARGQERMLGFLHTVFTTPLAMKYTATKVSGISEDQMDAYQRTSDTPWEKGSVLIPIRPNDNGGFDYVNLSTLLPYDTLYRFANRAWQEYEQGKDKGMTTDEAMMRAAPAMLTEFLKPYFSESIVTSVINDIIASARTGTGRAGDGTEIFNPMDPSFIKVLKSALHTVDAVMPNIVPIDIKSGEVVPSRFARGVVGELFPELINPVDKYGKQHSAREEVMRQMMGVTVQEFDPKRSLGYKAYEFAGERTDARSMFNSLLNDENITADKLVSGFMRANEAKFRADRKMFETIQGMRELGMSDREIARIFNQQNIYSVDYLMDGLFEAFSPTEENYSKMARSGVLGEYPAQQIKAIQREWNRLSLERQYDQAPSRVSPERPVGRMPDVSVPSVSGMGSASPDAFSQMMSAAYRQTTGLDTLSNPADRQIAERLGR